MFSENQDASRRWLFMMDDIENRYCRSHHGENELRSFDSGPFSAGYSQKEKR